VAAFICIVCVYCIAFADVRLDREDRVLLFVQTAGGPGRAAPGRAAPSFLYQRSCEGLTLGLRAALLRKTSACFDDQGRYD
jgi:hypothetical protein